jgi:hypothetical protein
MSTSLARVLAAVLICALGIAAPAAGQPRSASTEPRGSPPLRLGPVALAPAATVYFGWDSNIFQRQDLERLDDARPASDITATAAPEILTWTRLGAAGVSTRSTFAFVYFQKYASERSVDQNHEARLDLRLGPVTPYVAGNWLRARQRFGFEIDQRILRHQTSAATGMAIRLGPRTTIDVGGYRGRWEFESPYEVVDPFISDEFYDYTSEGLTFAFNRALTPMTSLVVTMDKHQDRFDIPGRDSDSVSFASGLVFKPLAMLRGSASVGWQRLDRLTPGLPPFSGPVASVDLGYQLFGTTNFTVQAQRDLTYSASPGQHAYVLSGLRAAVNHNLAGNWEVAGRIGRHHLSYGLFDGIDTDASNEAPTPFTAAREIVTEYSGEVAYRFSPAIRMAFEFYRQERESSVGARDYGRTRTGLSLRYEF